jgi:hypothetical protein
MRPLPLALLGFLAACNGSSDGDTAAAPEGARSEMTIEARRGGGGGPGTTPAPASSARDPGPRVGPAGAGAPLAGLGAMELAAFEIGREDFAEEEGVGDGLGPTMNLDSCGGCHSQPAFGGTSPAVNPQLAFATKLGAGNTIPAFLSADGPVREARFVRNPDGSRDGGVHALFTVRGRSDAPGCEAQQPDFAAALANRNVVFRIPTPVFGAGLIEQIPDLEILANAGRAVAAKTRLGIRGRGNVVLPQQAISAQANKNGNDGTVGRFGWKAQNKSLLTFSGEAYNVEMGITNDLFPTERDESDACTTAAQPNSVTNLYAATPLEGVGSIEKFTLFMRLLAAPEPSPDRPGGASSLASGRAAFQSAGCALCHTPTLRTGNAGLPALRQRDVNLFSDLLLHDMGNALADGIVQGQASGREFRTAPLWGLGQRLFFLHDGRTSDLREAILAHRSSGSEANAVIERFIALPDAQQQDLLNFLRSL